MNKAFSNDHLDEQSRALAHELDALAAHDATANTSAIEARIIAATGPIIAGSKAPAAVVHEASRTRGRSHAFSRALVRTGAVMMLALVVGAAWIGLQPAARPSVAMSFEPLEVDAMLAGLEALDGGLASGTMVDGGSATDQAESSIRSWDPAGDVESLGGSM